MRNRKTSGVGQKSCGPAEALELDAPPPASPTFPTGAQRGTPGPGRAHVFFCVEKSRLSFWGSWASVVDLGAGVGVQRKEDTGAVLGFNSESRTARLWKAEL